MCQPHGSHCRVTASDAAPLLLCCHGNIFPSLTISPSSHHAAASGCENWLWAGQNCHRCLHGAGGDQGLPSPGKVLPGPPGHCGLFGHRTLLSCHIRETWKCVCVWGRGETALLLQGHQKLRSGPSSRFKPDSSNSVMVE